MAKYDVPKSDFQAHPAGQHRGTIVEVEDKGMVTTQFGNKHKVAIKIESSTAKMDDGRPFIVQQWHTLSGHEKSGLRKLREILAGRKLTDDEAHAFDDSEIIGKKVGFVILHTPGREGGTFANIQSIWPLDGGNGSSAQAGPPEPAIEALRPAPDEVARYIKLVNLMTSKGMYAPGDAEKAIAWAEGKATAEQLDSYIIRSIASLKKHGVEIPEGLEPAIAGPPSSDSDLPF